MTKTVMEQVRIVTYLDDKQTSNKLAMRSVCKPHGKYPYYRDKLKGNIPLTTGPDGILVLRYDVKSVDVMSLQGALRRSLK